MMMNNQTGGTGAGSKKKTGSFLSRQTKSRQHDKRPGNGGVSDETQTTTTEEELAKKGNITPEEVLRLERVTEGK